MTPEAPAPAADVSVVIPTKDRPELLRQSLRAVLDQTTDVTVEVVVVNDKGVPVDDVVAGHEHVTLVQGPGVGPAAARNAGIARATGAIVLFTDDDAVPQPGWIQAAADALRDAPEAVGAVGHVMSPPFDPLYEHSVENGDGVGNFVTCNAAYRRSALDALGGFDEGFPYPAAEDRDLGYRMQQLGRVLFVPSMVVVHPPRAVSVKSVIRRGRFLESDWRLHLKHPQTRPPRWSTRWGPFVRLARQWQRLLTEDHVVGRSPRRAVRFARMAGGQLAVASAVTVRGPRERVGVARSLSTGGGPPALRLAWIGPDPRPGAGAAGCAWLIVAGLSALGCEIDCFLTGPPEDVTPELAALRGVRVVTYDSGWRFDRWYSNHSTTKVTTGLAATAWARRRLASLVVEQHEVCPYDVVYQFSTIELFGLRRRLARLPPLVTHPSTHIAGELRWVKAERSLAARCEPRWRRLVIEAMLTTRAKRQRRDIKRATRVLAISPRFGEHLVADYGVDPSKLSVVRNPIDLEQWRPRATRADVTTPLRIVFVSRISARKGVDLVIELSHRLADLEGTVVLELVGAETLWSDYRPLLADLDPRIARYLGPMASPQLADLLAGSDFLVQAAKYEPFGLTVGEALASGVPVVATDEVGAAQDVDPRCCIVVRADDADALEQGVREMIARLQAADVAAVAQVARAEAERLFAPDLIARLTRTALEETAARRPVIAP